MSAVHPHPTLIQAIHSPSFAAVLPKLVACAARCLRHAGWAEGVHTLPSAAEAEEVVHDALVSGLCGDRKWPAHLDLVTFLCGVIRSQISHQRREAMRWPQMALEDSGDAEAPSSRRAARLDAHRLLAMIEGTIEADPDMRALFTAIVDGADNRATQAAALGWTPEDVKLVREKMNRRLAALGLRDGEEDERDPGDRSSGEAPAPRRRTRRRTG